MKEQKEMMALKRKGILIQAATWMNLEDIMLRETASRKMTNIV